VGTLSGSYYWWSPYYKALARKLKPGNVAR